LEVVELRTMTRHDKALLVKELGYASDGTKVLRADQTPYLDPYTNDPVTLDNMAILPGSIVILDNNPVSLACYIAEHED
jgi:hypothetical protein